MSGVVHVVGAGLAGLACSLKLAQEGRKVALYEAARMAGGRCRSYFDAALGLTIDNGNHLLLSGNRAARDYLARIGASDALVGPEQCVFDFEDFASGLRWRLAPNASRLPWWIFVEARRVPGSKPLDYLGAAKLLYARPDATIGETMDCSGLLYERIWRPVLLSALNMEPSEASAALAGAVLRETLAAGGDACRPMVAKDGLGPAFIDPALKTLSALGVDVVFGARLRGISFDGDRASRLDFGDRQVALEPGDRVVLAVPPWTASELLPDLVAPNEFLRDPQRALQNRAAAGAAALAGARRKLDRVAVRFRRSPLGHDQRRRPADGRDARGSGGAHLGRGRESDGPPGRAPALADRQRKARDLRRDA